MYPSLKPSRELLHRVADSSTIGCSIIVPNRTELALKLVGKEVPAADGGNYGHRILSYSVEHDEFTVQAINWSSRKILDLPSTIDYFKASYRYQLDKARDPIC